MHALFEGGGAVFRLLALAAALPMMAAAAVRDAQPDAENALDRLRAGEVVLEQRSEAGGETGAVVSILVQAPAERVWSVIVSCDDAFAFVAGLRQCEVLEERGDYALTHQIVDKGWATPRLDYVFETRRMPYERMTFRLVSGNLRTMQGAWSFEATAEGLLVRHELLLAPLVPAPQWLVRRNLRQDLPDMLRCIRALAQGSPDKKAADADRAACAEARAPAAQTQSARQ